jgi:hypothetical protein
MVAGFGGRMSAASVTQPGQHRHPRIAAHALDGQPDAPAALRRLADRAADLARRGKGVGFRRPHHAIAWLMSRSVTPQHDQMMIIVVG